MNETPENLGPVVKGPEGGWLCGLCVHEHASYRGAVQCRRDAKKLHHESMEGKPERIGLVGRRRNTRQRAERDRQQREEPRPVERERLAGRVRREPGSIWLTLTKALIWGWGVLCLLFFLVSLVIGIGPIADAAHQSASDDLGLAPRLLVAFMVFVISLVVWLVGMMPLCVLYLTARPRRAG